jgi:hypothetical protein
VRLGWFKPEKTSPATRILATLPPRKRQSTADKTGDKNKKIAELEEQLASRQR